MGHVFKFARQRGCQQTTWQRRARKAAWTGLAPWAEISMTLNPPAPEAAGLLPSSCIPP